MPIYIKIDGIKGESRDARFKGWMQLEGISPQSSSWQHSAPFKTITIARYLDSASPHLFRAWDGSRPLGRALIVSDSGNYANSYGLVLWDTMISGHTLSGYYPDRATESLSLNFKRMEFLLNAQVFAALALGVA